MADVRLFSCLQLLPPWHSHHPCCRALSTASFPDIITSTMSKKVRLTAWNSKVTVEVRSHRSGPQRRLSTSSEWILTNQDEWVAFHHTTAFIISFSTPCGSGPYLMEALLPPQLVSPVWRGISTGPGPGRSLVVDPSASYEGGWWEQTLHYG